MQHGFEKAIEIGGDSKTYVYLGLQQYFGGMPYKSNPSEAYQVSNIR